MAWTCAAALGLWHCGSEAPVVPQRVTDEVPKVDPAEVARQKAQADATAQAELQAHGVISGADAAFRRVVDATVPKPAWSMFPGLSKRAERLRESVVRERLGGDKPVWLLMLDTTRADNLSVYGYNRDTTPNLAKLAEEGYTFSRFYSNGSWTRPSVASIMTSHYRGDHKVEISASFMPNKAKTVAEVFKQNDYATAAIVGNQTVRSYYNFHQGFKHYEDVHDEIEHNPKADELVDRAIKWLDKNDNPNFFLWTFLVDPHDPYNPLPENDKWPTGYTKRIVTPYVEYPRGLPKPYVERMVSLYDAEIYQMDKAIGRMIQYFKDKGIWDDLTVVVVVDHGEAFGEHNCFRHPFHFWEPNIHVPFIVRSPELKTQRGTVEDRLFNGIDVAPTMLDLAGVTNFEGWRPSGISAADVLSGPITEGWDRTVYTEQRAYGMRRWMVRRGNWKFLRFNPTDEEKLKEVWDTQWEFLISALHTDTRRYLFNVADDPWETKNLAKKNPKIVKAFDAELKKFRRAVYKGKLRNDPPEPVALPTPVAAKKTTPPTSDDGKDDPNEGETDSLEMDPRALEDLRQLGYVGDGPAEPAPKNTKGAKPKTTAPAKDNSKDDDKDDDPNEGETDSLEMDPKALEDLRQLGYVGDGPAEEAPPTKKPEQPKPE